MPAYGLYGEHCPCPGRPIRKAFGLVLRIVQRNQVRDYLDTVVLFERLGKAGIRDALRPLDELYPQASGASVLAEVIERLGSSIVMTVQGGPTIFDLPLYTMLGLGGYLIAFCNSVWIMFGIWRAGK